MVPFLLLSRKKDLNQKKEQSGMRAGTLDLSRFLFAVLLKTNWFMFLIQNSGSSVRI